MANQAFSARYRLPDGRYAVNVDSAKTLTAADSGIVQNVIAASVVVTLPATAVVGTWTIRDGGVAATSAAAGAIANPAYPSVDPAAADTVAGFNVSGTAADGKYLTNTSGRVGDEIRISNTGATDGGVVTASIGDWTREA